MALAVLCTWGWSKLHSLYATTVQGVKPWASTGFVRLVAQLGFPFPAFFAACAALNESFVAAALTLGLLTRFSAIIATLGMMGALYAGIMLGEEVLLPGICVVGFAALVLLQAGRYSVDQAIFRHSQLGVRQKDAGLLLLRVGAEFALLGSVISAAVHGKLGAKPLDWLIYGSAIVGVLVAIGLWTRIFAGLLSALWFVAMLNSVFHGQRWQALGALTLLMALAYCAVALTGAGEWSLDYRRAKARLDFAD